MVATESRRHFLTRLGTAALVPFLPGCKVSSAPLAIASHVWPGYELMFLARNEGWLADAGISLIETASATQSMAALRRGEVLGAALTLDEVLRLRTERLPLVVILVFDISAGADVVLGQPGIKSLADLRGRRIGVEETAVGATMLHKALVKAGIPRDAVELVPVTVDAHLTAWREGRVDALVTYEPTAGKLMADGAIPLLDSRALPDTIFDVLAVMPEAAQSHAKALRSLVAGHFRALEHLRRNPVDAGYRLAKRLGIPGNEALDAFRGIALPDVHANRRLLANDGNGPVLSIAHHLSAIMVEHGLITGAPALDGLVRADFLPRGA